MKKDRLDYNKRWRKEHPDYSKKRYLKNKEKMDKYTKKWRMENPQRIKEIQKKCYQKNKEHLNEYVRKWREEHPDYAKENAKEWRKGHPEYATKWARSNPDKVREKNLKRRANGIIKKGIISQIINENIFKYGIITCEACKKECESNYHIDHVLPISKGGNNNYDNLQILCTKCNLQKSIKIVDYRKKLVDKQLFLKGRDLNETRTT